MTLLTFVNGFQIRNVDEEADITISKANNSINFDKMAYVLHDNIKIVYMKFDFDFNVVLKEVDDIKMEYKRQNETNPELSRTLYSWNYDKMVDLANKIEESEKKLPKFFIKEGTYINIDGTVKYESEEVIEISQKKLDEIGLGWYEQVERTDIFDRLLEIDDFLRDYRYIVDQMLLYRDGGRLYFSEPFVKPSVVNIATAINQIEEKHENYEINWQYSEGIMFKQISKGRYEILQKMFLTSPDNTYELWSRDTFPLVYQNVLIDIEDEKTSGNYIAIHHEKQEFGLVSSVFLNIFGDLIREVDENGFVFYRQDLKKCVEKGIDFLCQRTLETYPISKLSENCEGAIFQANGAKIREFCDWKLVKSKVVKSKTAGSDIILFNPEPIVATMDCNEKIIKKWNKDEFQLQGLQRLSIPTFCSLKTSQYVINGGFSGFKDGIQIHFNDTGLETIWPELSPKNNFLTEVLNTFSTQMIHMESLCWIGFVALFVHTVLSRL